MTLPINPYVAGNPVGDSPAFIGRANVLCVVHPDTPFEEWLQAQAWEGLLTRGEKQQLEKATRAVVDLLTGGVPKLIEAVIKKVIG